MKKRPKLEPEIHWREREQVYFQIRTIGLEQGAFAVKTMYEEALVHKDWPTVAQKLLERYQHHEEIPHTWTQLVNSGLLKDMPNIFPNTELNPVVVPGFIICRESSISDKQVFVIVNVEAADRFRYTSSTIVKMSELS